MRVIRDAVHGDLEFDPRLELFLIDTPEFQRLRGIKQLGTAYLVYPGALHTRFEHSLGTAFLARKMLERLAVEPELRDAAIVAALLHDLTHIPFGHTFEDERRVFPRHDSPQRTRRFLQHGELGRRLRALGLSSTVGSILCGEPASPFLSEITSAAVGADLLDYLARDAVFCGLRQAYDERIFRYFSVQEGHFVLRLVDQGRVRRDLLSEVIHLLRIRYTLSERVYFHHAKISSGAMLSRAVERGVELGLTLEELFPLTDAGLLDLLLRRFGHDSTIRDLVQRFQRRELFKRSYSVGCEIGEEKKKELVERYHTGAEARAVAEAELAAQVGLRREDLLIYCPGTEMGKKDADIPVVLDGASPVLLSSLHMDEVENILRKHRDLWRFHIFCAPERRDCVDRIVTACEEYFDLPARDPAS